jgi:hypothetical protein
LPGDTLETLPEHLGYVVAAWALSAVALAPVLFTVVAAPQSLGSLALVFLAAVVFSDFFSGLFHWATGRPLWFSSRAASCFPG